MSVRSRSISNRAVAPCMALTLLCAAGYCQADAVTLPFQIGGAYTVPITSIKEARYRSMVRQQFDFSCGSAALSTLLTHHYGYRVDEQTVFEKMFATGDREKIQREGFSLLDMKVYLQSYGFQADGFEAPLEKLEQAKIPAIVLINEKGYNHFVVVKGIDRDRVLIGDPSGGTRGLTRAAFGLLWTNGIFFVIYNRQELARFNLAQDWHAAPRAPIGGHGRDGGTNLALPKLGPSDF